MKQQELIAQINIQYMQSLENLALAKENVKTAQKFLQESGQTYRNAAKLLAFKDRYNFIHAQLKPYQDAVRTAENNVIEAQKYSDNFRNLLEAAEISIEAYNELVAYFSKAI